MKFKGNCSAVTQSRFGLRQPKAFSDWCVTEFQLGKTKQTSETAQDRFSHIFYQINLNPQKSCVFICFWKYLIKNNAKTCPPAALLRGRTGRTLLRGRHANTSVFTGFCKYFIKNNPKTCVFSGFLGYFMKSFGFYMCFLRLSWFFLSFSQSEWNFMEFLSF